MAYLRVVAGMFGYIFLLGAVDFLFHTVYSTSIVMLLMAVGLLWFALYQPIRESNARREAREAALIARAEAGHAAFLARDPAAFAPPPPVEPEPRMAAGLKVVIAIAVGFALLVTLGVVFGGAEGEQQSAMAIVSVI